MTIENLQRHLTAELAIIARLFKPGAKITLVVRHPFIEGDTGVVTTNDDLDEVIKELRLRQADERKAAGIPMIYPCGCSHLKVGLGMCDQYKPGEVP